MKRIICNVLLFVPAVFAVMPLLFLITGTFMGTGEVVSNLAPVLTGGEGFAKWRFIPQYLTLRNIVELLFDAPEFYVMFWNTQKTAAGILLGQLVFGVPAAWGLARFAFPGKKQVYLLYILLMMMPFQVTMLSEYLVLDGMGLLDTLWAVILPGVFQTFPPFIMYRFFRGIPEALLEAARVDGAGELTLFFRVGVPSGSAGIFSALVLTYLECQNMIEQPLAFLTSRHLWPLALYLPEVDAEGAGFALCASFVALLPALLVFLWGQEYLEQGIAAAAVKE